MSETKDISIAREGEAVVITLDRPEAFNSLTPEMIAELPRALNAAAADPTCRTIVLTGSGDRAFCAGIDVKSVARRDATAGTSPPTELDPITAQFENLHLRLSGIIRTIHSLPVPIIAAVNGHAIGAGLAMAAACDLRLGSEAARLADGFVKRGISGCEMGLSYFLPKIVGPALAFEWMMTGRRITAEEAASAGFFSEVTSDAELLPRALAIAEELAANAPMAIAMTKEVMWLNLQAASLDHALALESRTQVMTRNTGDAAEARQAFLEKRPTEFATRHEPRPPRV